MPLGQVEGALSGGTNKSFIRKRHPDLGFTQNYISSSRETSVKAGKRICAVTCRQKKAIYFSLKPSNSMFLKGKSRIHIETDAQEIKLYFVTESLSSELLMHGVPEITQNSGA